MTINRKPVLAILAGIFALQAPMIFEKGANAQELPARCTGQGELHSISLTSWNSGLGTWTVGTHDVANPATFDTPDWKVVDDLPDGRGGMAAFVPNLNIGDCGADDESGALSLDSPTIQIQADAEVPRLSFLHWFETEYGWDGGNLKISVNGAPFVLVPATAFESGAYNDILLPPLDEFELQYNTNPLASEEAFTGTHDFGPSGAWIESRVNLLGIAQGGDSVRLRFDFGIDACDGAEGWYVDNVEIYSCAAEVPPSDCGNGLLDDGEQCDDGNNSIGDGCSNTCQVESGWQCTEPGPAANIGDPSFEAGTPNPAWNEQSNNLIGTPICDLDTCGTGGGSGPSDGDFWAWFGGVSSGLQEGSLSQTVVIPQGATNLTFDLEIPACDSSADYVEVLVDGNREWIINGTSNLCGDSGYSRQSVDVGDYADGGSHELEFHSETFANNNGVSNFFIDLVAITGSPSVCTPEGPSLTLVKQIVNNNGGTAVPADWTLTATGPTSLSGTGPTVTSGTGFAAGVYTLSESGGPPGYIASAWVCEGGTQLDADSISIALGEFVTCTITNDDPPTDFVINAGLNDSWYNPATSGQGFFITVFPDIGKVFLAWFTYETERPDESLMAILGEPAHRWLTAFGDFAGHQAVLDIEITEGGTFDSPDPQPAQDLDGTILLEFTGCTAGTVTYDITSLGLQGVVPIQRLAPDNVPFCEELATLP